MNEFLTVVNGLSQPALLVAVIIVMARLLQPVSNAYAETVRTRKDEAGHRRERDDNLALELARYQKEQAALNLQAMALQAEIAKVLPVLAATSQQTLATVQETGPQIETVGDDLADLIKQLHKITSDMLVVVNRKQDTQAATMGRIEQKQDDRQALEQAG